MAMTPPQRRPAEYSADARQRLGEAIEAARIAAGYRWRTNFADDTSISKRTIQAIERGEPTVSFRMLKEVGQALGRRLPGWTEDTPRQILEGASAPEPPTEGPDVVEGEPGEMDADPPVESLEWLEKYAEFPHMVRKWKEVKRLEAARDAAIKYLAEQAAQVAERELSDEHG